VDGLLTRLDAGGHAEAAAELRRGFSCLNGLTDGWALFLESIEKVEAEHAARFAGEERRELAAVRRAVRRAVYGPR